MYASLISGFVYYVCKKVKKYYRSFNKVFSIEIKHIFLYKIQLSSVEHKRAITEAVLTPVLRKRQKECTFLCQGYFKCLIFIKSMKLVFHEFDKFKTFKMTVS